MLNWLRLIHTDLPALVKQRYGKELRSKTLASIKPEISQALDSLLEEIETTNDAKILCTAFQRSGERDSIKAAKPKGMQKSCHYVNRLNVLIPSTSLTSVHSYPLKTANTYHLEHFRLSMSKTHYVMSINPSQKQKNRATPHRTPKSSLFLTPCLTCTDKLSQY